MPFNIVCLGNTPVKIHSLKKIKKMLLSLSLSLSGVTFLSQWRDLSGVTLSYIQSLSHKVYILITKYKSHQFETREIFSLVQSSDSLSMNWFFSISINFLYLDIFFGNLTDFITKTLWLSEIF